MSLKNNNNNVDRELGFLLYNVDGAAMRNVVIGCCNLLSSAKCRNGILLNKQIQIICRISRWNPLGKV